jgi:predicted Rossmann-fold nucleotide-binding protein
MTDPVPPKRLFHPAREEAEIAAGATSSAQTEDSAYRLAFQDTEFLLREDLRPVRFQLELLKPELLLDEAKIASTFVIYGSARIPEPDKADALIESASTDEQRRIAEKLKEKSRFYEEARQLARLASRVGPDAEASGISWSAQGAARRSWKPPIAARRTKAPIRSASTSSAARAAAEPVRHAEPELPVPLFRAAQDALPAPRAAVAVFPGGFGTFDEMFELLTLIQTGKIKPLPILLFGSDYWNRVVNFGALVEEGVVSARDLDLFKLVETAEEGWSYVCDHFLGTDQMPECVT